MGNKIEVIAARNVYYGGVTKTFDPATGVEKVLDHNKLYLEGQRLFIDEEHFTDADKYIQRKDEKTGKPIGPKVFGSFRRVHPAVPVVVPVKEAANQPVPMSEIVPPRQPELIVKKK